MKMITHCSIAICIAVALTAVLASGDAIDNGRVCGSNGKTYPSLKDATAQGIGVMHCGACGSCSNDHDIGIYKSTRKTLTKTATHCAYLTAILGKKVGSKCMKDKIGFTPECNKCWMANIMCDEKHCKWTCLKWKWLGIGKFHGKLDPCLACDEAKCGPAFTKCAGANRRRCGIQSDIERPEEQLCSFTAS